MTIQEIYDLAIQMGTKADPRGVDGVKKYLIRAKKQFEALGKDEKEYFDNEALTNPYSDTRILFGEPKKTIKKIMAGIDMNAGEVLLADRLNQKGEKIDLLIGHHPEGGALAALGGVMDIQVDLMESFGVPVHIAESLLSDRVTQVTRRIGPINHQQNVETARLLNLPFMVIHTVWDNLGFRFMSDFISKKESGFDTVGDVYDAIMEIPEFQISKKGGAGPMITSGNKNRRAGRVAVSGFTGGTEGSKHIYEKLSHAGVGTIIEMHMSEEHFEEAKKNHLNMIVSGHMASDSIGANLFLDELEKKGIEVIPCSGLIRVKRGGKKS